MNKLAKLYLESTYSMYYTLAQKKRNFEVVLRVRLTGIEFISTEIELNTQDLSSFLQELSWTHKFEVRSYTHNLDQEFFV